MFPVLVSIKRHWMSEQDLVLFDHYAEKNKHAPATAKALPLILVSWTDWIESEIMFGADQYIGLQILSADIGLSQMYWYWHIYCPICADIKTILRLEEKLTSDLNWGNYVVCPAEGGPLFSK